MTYRKLIKFGDSSYVVSLPKKWVEDRHLKKGDLISLKEDGTGLSIRVLENETEEKQVKQTTINVDNLKSFRHVKPILSAAYINNFDMITLTGNTLYKESEIDTLIQDLVALEVIQKSKDKIILKDFLNIKEVSIHEELRRVDRTIFSIMTDLKEVIKTGQLDLKEDFKERDRSINRLCYLMYKSLKKASDPNYRDALHLNMDSLVYYWSLITLLEDIGNQLKRAARHVKNNNDSALAIVIDRVISYYTSTMNSIFKNDLDNTVEFASQKKNIMAYCDTHLESLSEEGYIIMEKLKNVVNSTSSIALSFIRYKYI